MRLGFSWPSGSGEGDLDGKGSPLPRLANDGDFASEQSGPFPHCQGDRSIWCLRSHQMKYRVRCP